MTPDTKWRWLVFGRQFDKDGKEYIPMLVQPMFNITFGRRLLTRIFLGSVWERLEDNNETTQA